MQTTSHLSIHDPDGVPHQIVGLTWLFAFAAAILAFLALTRGGAMSALALLLVPTLLVGLDRRARRQRHRR